jgi:hypothetical protein
MSPRTRRTGLIAVLLLAASGAATGLLNWRYHLTDATMVLGLAGGVIGLPGLWLTFAGYRDDRRSEDESASLESVVDELAAAVRDQWYDEAARRQLNDPSPLPVRWRAADLDLVTPWAELERLARHGVGWPQPLSGGVWAGAPEELEGGEDELAEVWKKVPTGRLLVLGEPGAGKTMLLVRLVLDLLAAGRRSPGSQVPLLVSVASWDPFTQDLYTWLAGRMVLDFPALGRLAPAGAGRENDVSIARALLDRGLIMMVLDGLDEIPADARTHALAGINQVILPGQALIVSSRTDDYRTAARPPVGGEVTLAGTAGIELCALRPVDVIEYLRKSAGGPAGERRWVNVAGALAAQAAAAAPDAPLSAITTPLMATLARAIYNPSPGEDATSLPDPDELLIPSARSQVEERLLDGLIPAAYRPHPSRQPRNSPEQARRWLGYFAYQLELEHRGVSDVAWWQFRGPRPPARSWLRRLSAVGICGMYAVCAAVAVLALFRLAIGVYPWDFAVSAVVYTASAFAIVGLVTGSTADAQRAAIAAGIVGGLTATLGLNNPTTMPPAAELALVAGIASGFASRAKAAKSGDARTAIWIMVLANLTCEVSAGTDWAFGSRLGNFYYGFLQAVPEGMLLGLTVYLAAALRSPASSPRRRWAFQPVISGILCGTVVFTAGDLLQQSGWIFSPQYLEFWSPLGNGATVGTLGGLVTFLTGSLAGAQRVPKRKWIRNPLFVGIVAGGVILTADELQGSYGLTDGLTYAIFAGCATAIACAHRRVAVAPWCRWIRRPVVIGAFSALAITVSVAIHLGAAMGVSYSFAYTANYGLANNGVDGASSPLLIGSFAGAAVYIANGFATTVRAQPRFRRWFHRPVVVGALAAVAVAAVNLTAIIINFQVEVSEYGPASIASTTVPEEISYSVSLGLKIGLFLGLASYLVESLAGASTRKTSWCLDPLLSGLFFGAIYSIIFGTDVGLMFGVVAGLAVELSVRVGAQSAPVSGLRWTPKGLVAGLLAGALAWIFSIFTYGTDIAPLIGVAVGCAGALILGADVPRRITPPRSPLQSLMRDRSVFLSLAFGTMLILGVAVSIVAGLGDSIQIWTGLVGALTYGTALGGFIAAGKASWGRYAVARLGLLRKRQAPWGVMLFLSEAHQEYGILRQNGATFQFRHVDLQHRLAHTYEREFLSGVR